MQQDDINIRPARREDAADLARLFDLAGEGLPSHLWSEMAEPGQSVWDVGARRAARDTGAFSWRNAWIAERNGQIAACLIGYTQPDEPEPIDPELPAMFVPLQELENTAPGTFYVNVLATRPEHQGRGIGGRLLEFAESYAGPNGMSLIVSDANRGARRLYERHGYELAASRAMIKDGWEHAGKSFLLMVKGADQARSG